MFRQAKNIDSAFRQLRLFSILVIISCCLISCYVIYNCYKSTVAVQSRIYILANGKALEAFAGDRKENIPVEARDHVKMFHTYFFSLDPDDKVIQSNINKALYLADGSAKRVYESLKENNYYTGIISGNVSQEITVDSVRVNTKVYPYYFRCFATEKITRITTITTRSLITEGYLRNVSRSDNNPHGFLIEKWNTIQNKDLKTENR
ncbi:conjugative transposon protein TraK [Ginsengibacter hankyongi]|uniref:Conjugative transposon protein TraK n=1 Tax=Ginsengibacter hankyongi TaxID=2607284 RepID=A0A5J5IGA6_9BACT|nr:conjugative transposon protein TraK [Ginsengibacter hankyongi]KAA9038694.1 conjugative transposon protein TraK [Ginsengibacter hankyongi]